MKVTLGPFNASLTKMGPMHGVLIPTRYWDTKEFKDLLPLKKHKITVIIEKVDPSSD